MNFKKENFKIISKEVQTDTEDIKVTGNQKSEAVEYRDFSANLADLFNLNGLLRCYARFTSFERLVSYFIPQVLVFCQRYAKTDPQYSENVQKETQTSNFLTHLAWLSTEEWEKHIKETFKDMLQQNDYRKKVSIDFESEEAMNHSNLLEHNWMVNEKSTRELDIHMQKQALNKDDEYNQHLWLIRQNYWSQMFSQIESGHLTRNIFVKEWSRSLIKMEYMMIHKRVYDYWISELKDESLDNQTELTVFIEEGLKKSSEKLFDGYKWSQFYNEIVIVLKNLIDSQLVSEGREEESQFEEEENVVDEKTKLKEMNLMPILKNYESYYKESSNILNENWFNFMNFIFKEYIKTKVEL